MKILALELTTALGSIAWRDGSEQPLTETFANDRKHSGPFFENLRLVFDAHGKPDRLVVGLGPGSYAGTRIAIAAAIGVQAASSAELIGIPSLCAMPTDADEYCALGDARRQTFYFAIVQSRRWREAPTLHTGDELDRRLAAVEGPVFTTEPLSRFPHAQVAYPSAAILAELGTAEHENALGEPLEPLYLRDPHITQPKATPAVIARR